eukprot:RCo012251
MASPYRVLCSLFSVSATPMLEFFEKIHEAAVGALKCTPESLFITPKKMLEPSTPLTHKMHYVLAVLLALAKASGTLQSVRARLCEQGSPAPPAPTAPARTVQTPVKATPGPSGQPSAR